MGPRKKLKLFLDSNKDNKQPLSISDYYAVNYSTWRKYRKKSAENYYILPVELKAYLPIIRSNALNLYLFYCLNANNENGKSWYSTESLADALDTTPKSINNWNKQLINLDLIARVKDKQVSATTFLLPISNYFIRDKTNDFKEYIQNIKQDIDGKLSSITHLFQWRKDHDTDKYNHPYNVLLITLEKEVKVDDFKIVKNKYILLEIHHDLLTNFQISLNADEFKEDIYQFDSPLYEIMNNSSILIKGIAIATVYNLKDSDYKNVLETVETIASNLINMSKDTPEKIKN